MSYKTEKGFEFELTGAQYELEDDGSRVERVVLKTGDVENDQITVKPRVKKQVGTAGGVPKYKNDQLPEIEDLPENLQKVAKAASSSDDIVRAVASVTELDRSDEPEMNGDGKYYFISQEDIDTLELRDIPGKETGGKN